MNTGAQKNLAGLLNLARDAVPKPAPVRQTKPAATATATATAKTEQAKSPGHPPVVTNQKPRSGDTDDLMKKIAAGMSKLAEQQKTLAQRHHTVAAVRAWHKSRPDTSPATPDASRRRKIGGP